MSTNEPPSQHIASPWRASFIHFDGRYPEINGIPYLEVNAGSGYAGNPEKPGFTFTSYMTPANAALIVAAPKMFAALAHLIERDWFNDGDSGQVVCVLDADLVRDALMTAKNFPTRPADDDGEPQSSYCSSEKPEPDGDLDETDIHDAYTERKMEQADRLHDELKDRQWEGVAL